MTPFTLSIDQIEAFLLVFVRVTSILLLMPVFGADTVPPQLKAALCLLLSVLLFPIVTIAGPHEPLAFAGFMVLVIKEVFVGLVVGFSTTFLFAAVQFAGRLIDTEIGFAMVELMDPFTSASVSSTAQLQILIFTIYFLLFNGQFFFLLALQKSFELIPLYGVQFPEGNLLAHFTRMGADVLVLGIQFAAPVFIILSLTSMSLGIIARTVPQINIFFVGMPMKIVLGMVTTIIALPILATMFKSMYGRLIEDIYKVLLLMA